MQVDLMLPCLDAPFRCGPREAAFILESLLTVFLPCREEQNLATLVNVHPELVRLTRDRGDRFAYFDHIKPRGQTSAIGPLTRSQMLSDISLLKATGCLEEPDCIEYAPNWFNWVQS